MTHCGRTLAEYNVQELRDLFLEMFCATRTAVDNPMMQPSGMAQRRSFLVMDEGEIDGTTGYWAENEDDGAEGFLEALEDVFWVYDENEYTWYQRRFQGRETRRGKGKGKRKGKGKGRGGRRFFRSRRKGKGKGRRKAGSHMVGEEGYDEEWQEEEEEWNDYDGYWAEEQDWNDAYWGTDELYYKDEYGMFQRKGKGKNGKKRKKGKDDEGKGKPGDGKGKSNYVQPSTSSNQPIQNQPQQVHYSSSMSSNTGHGFVSLAETDPVRVDVLEATYDEQSTRRTRRAGQNVRDARSEANKERMKYDPVHVGQLGARAYKPEVRFPVLEGDVDTLRQGIRRRPLPPGLHERPLQPGLQPEEEEEEGTSFFTHGDSEQSEIPVDTRTVDSDQSEIPVSTKVGDSSQEEKPSQYESSQQSEESSEKDRAFSFHTNPVDACETGLAFHMENSAPPTVCILDLCCTRAMGSRKAVDSFCRYVDSHPNSGLWYEIHPTSSRFFFAHSQQSKCTEKIFIFMHGHGWNSQFTEFDIVEEGDVPLLMSLPQMRNLGFQFELTPEKAYLSCARIGMRKMVLKTAISTHLILDLQDIAWYMSQVNFKTPQVKSFFLKT